MKKAFNVFTGELDLVGSGTSSTLFFEKIISDAIACEIISHSEFVSRVPDGSVPVFLRNASIGSVRKATFAVKDCGGVYVTLANPGETVLKGFVPLSDGVYICKEDGCQYYFDGSELRKLSDGGLISLTCSEFAERRRNGALIPGKQYLIEDYRTFYYKGQHSNMCEVNSLIPVIVTANGIRSIDPRARLADGSAEIMIEIYDAPRYAFNEYGLCCVINGKDFSDTFQDYEDPINGVTDDNGVEYFEYEFYNDNGKAYYVYLKYADGYNIIEDYPMYVPLTTYFAGGVEGIRWSEGMSLTAGGTICWADNPDYSNTGLGWGEITWMRDLNGNEAPFDFKSVRWKFTEEQYSFLPTELKNLYTTGREYGINTDGSAHNNIIKAEYELRFATMIIIRNSSNNTITITQTPVEKGASVVLERCVNCDILFNPIQRKGFGNEFCFLFGKSNLNVTKMADIKLYDNKMKLTSEKYFAFASKDDTVVESVKYCSMSDLDYEKSVRVIYNLGQFYLEGYTKDEVKTWWSNWESIIGNYGENIPDSKEYNNYTNDSMFPSGVRSGIYTEERSGFSFIFTPEGITKRRTHRNLNISENVTKQTISIYPEEDIYIITDDNWDLENLTICFSNLPSPNVCQQQPMTSIIELKTLGTIPEISFAIESGSAIRNVFFEEGFVFNHVENCARTRIWIRWLYDNVEGYFVTVSNKAFTIAR